MEKWAYMPVVSDCSPASGGFEPAHTFVMVGVDKQKELRKGKCRDGVFEARANLGAAEPQVDKIDIFSTTIAGCKIRVTRILFLFFWGGASVCGYYVSSLAHTHVVSVRNKLAAAVLHHVIHLTTLCDLFGDTRRHQETPGAAHLPSRTGIQSSIILHGIRR